MLKPKLMQREQGFSLVEVLVAILIATLYVTVTMQMMVVATIIKARAQEFVEATTWIQEDLEDIKYQAANYQYALLDAAASSTGKSFKLTSVDDKQFKDGDTLLIGTDSSNNIIAPSGVKPETKEITLNNELGTNWLIGSPVVVITRCNPPASNVGFADGLRDWITDDNHADGVTDITTNDTPSFNKTLVSKVTNKKFRLSRTATIYSTPNDFPYSLLKVSYDVLPIYSNGTVGPSIAKFYTNVIPNAALQCPS